MTSCPFCSPADRVDCLGLGRVVESGTTVAAAQSTADCAFLLRSGLVLVTEPTTGECSIATPGAFIGLDCLVSDTRLCDAMTILPSTMCVLPRESLLSYVADHPRSLRAIIDAAVEDPVVARRLDQL